MRRDSINYLAVGVVVSIAMLMLLYSLYRLTGGVDENTRYLVYYPNVAGLSEGTPVTYEGYKIGSVGRIEPVREGGRTRYRVTLMLRDGWLIPEDSVAEIAAEGLLAETVINIIEGDSTTAVAAGDELQGRLASDLFAAVGDVAETVNGLLTNDIRDLVANLDARISSIGDRVDEHLPQVLEQIDQLLTTLQATADRLPHFVDAEAEQQVDRIVANGVDISEQLLEFSNGLFATQAAADALLRDSRATVSENREDLRRSMIAMRYTLEELSASAEGILQNLESTSRNMNEFSRQLRRNPGLLLSGKPAAEVGVRRD